MFRGTKTNSREAQRFYLSSEQPEGAQAMLRSDDSVRDDVLSSLAADPWVSEQAIRVRVEDGTVVLDGEVERSSEKRAAGEDAWDTPGVKDVRNNLSVRMTEPPSRRERLALEPEVRPEER